MSRNWQVAIAGIVVAIILLIVGIPAWVPIVVLLAALAVPVVGYMMLDSNQRTRLRRIRQRKQLGR
jgi:MFS superfamily sulfate permease-like transporter